jgi:sialate O-acetylesterase
VIAPITPYTIRGVIWYQGENNAGLPRRADLYRRLFPVLIEDWRRQWGIGDFPFLFVQLANFRTQEGTAWPELREAQLMTLKLRNTAMVVTTDVGNPDDIHPTNKQEVGHRLALAARAVSYGEKLVYSGPIYRQMSREGKHIRLWFDHSEGGLVAKGGALRGFTIAGPDRRFSPADARIENNTVVVSSSAIADPLQVRYSWADNPDGNLCNAEGLPASPFRTHSPR